MIPPHLLVHAASVEPYAGSGAYGDTFGAAFNLPCFFLGDTRLAREAFGESTNATGVLYADLGPEIPTGSRVTVNGKQMIAVEVSPLDDGGLTGLDHLEVGLE